MNLVPRNGHLLGFRPEHLVPAVEAGSGAGDAVRFPFTVQREEYLGSERLLYGEIGETKAVARFPVTSPIVAEWGRAHEFAVSRSHLKVFDAQTGLRTGGSA